MSARLSPEMEKRIQILARKEGKIPVQMERELLEEALIRREKEVEDEIIVSSVRA